MKITVFTLKGGQGKTSLSLALALEYGFLVVTNDEYSPIDKVLPKGHTKHLERGESLPIVPDQVDLIYDFGGYPDERVIDALRVSDWVIVPLIYDSPQEMQTAIRTIKEIEPYNTHMLIVANKTQHNSLDKVQAILKDFVDYPLFEVKQTTAFSKMMDEGKAISQLMQESFLLKHHYKKPLEQIAAIKDYMDKG